MTRQTDFRLVFSAIHKKPIKDRKVNFVGDVTLVKGHTPVCKVEFWVDETQIYVTDLDTRERYKRCGYGRLTMDYMMFLAEILRKPIILYSFDTVIKFYEKIGMEHLDSKKMTKKIVVINEDPNHKHKWNDTDMIWLPKCLRRKKAIWMYV